MFDDKFLDSLPEDSILAADALCSEFLKFDVWAKKKATEVAGGSQNALTILAWLTPNPEYHDQYVEASAAFQAFPRQKIYHLPTQLSPATSLRTLK